MKVLEQKQTGSEILQGGSLAVIRVPGGLLFRDRVYNGNGVATALRFVPCSEEEAAAFLGPLA